MLYQLMNGDDLVAAYREELDLGEYRYVEEERNSRRRTGSVRRVDLKEGR